MLHQGHVLRMLPNSCLRRDLHAWALWPLFFGEEHAVQANAATTQFPSSFLYHVRLGKYSVVNALHLILELSPGLAYSC